MKKPPPEQVMRAVLDAEKAHGTEGGLAALDRMIDTVLAYKPKPKTKAAKRRKRKAQRDAKKG